MTEDRTRAMKRIARIAVLAAALGVPCAARGADAPAPSDWPIASKDYAGWRFADLADINAGNVRQSQGRLHVAA